MASTVFICAGLDLSHSNLSGIARATAIAQLAGIASQYPPACHSFSPLPESIFTLTTTPATLPGCLISKGRIKRIGSMPQCQL